MTPPRVPPRGAIAGSPPVGGTPEGSPGELASLGSAPGCSLRGSPVYHLAAEQMDDAEATFFSPRSGENESHQVLPTPSDQVPHPSRPGAADRALACAFPRSGAQGERETRTFLRAAPSLPALGLCPGWRSLGSRCSPKTEKGRQCRARGGGKLCLQAP